MTKKKTKGKKYSKSSQSINELQNGCRYCTNNVTDEANLLLCDNEEHCSVEIHSYCLNPPLVTVPTTQWFCPSCDLIGNE